MGLRSTCENQAVLSSKGHQEPASGFVSCYTGGSSETPRVISAGRNRLRGLCPTGPAGTRTVVRELAGVKSERLGRQLQALKP